MKKYAIIKYAQNDFNKWNDFVADSKNGTFLHNRNFMDYHSDRFKDHSLIVLENEKWTAVLPANIADNQLHSHQGLTYGGLLINNKIGLEIVENILLEIINYLKINKIEYFFFKQIPIFYSQSASSEMDYLLIKNNANIYRRDLNLAIDFSKPSSLSKSKLKHFNKIDKLNLDIKIDDSFESFWNSILTPRLSEKHNTKPVHSLEEIKFLKSKFPENIIQFNCYFNNEIIAGITLFIDKKAIKSQYGATSKVGETYRALDYLFINIIEKYKQNFDFFDMGIVTENNGKYYNSGLLKQKEELGCLSYIQDFYQLKIQ